VGQLACVEVVVGPEYDRPVFSTDGQRERILRVSSAEVLGRCAAQTHELVEAGDAAEAGGQAASRSGAPARLRHHSATLDAGSGRLKK
jgi:hypothetical protein